MTHPTPPNVTPEMVEVAARHLPITTRGNLEAALTAALAVQRPERGQPLYLRDDEMIIRKAEYEALAVQWRPIETAPKDGTDILLWGLPARMSTGWWAETIHGDHWSWDCDGQPTHWQPLPPPPQEGK